MIMNGFTSVSFFVIFLEAVEKCALNNFVVIHPWYPTVRNPPASPVVPDTATRLNISSQN